MWDLADKLFLVGDQTNRRRQRLSAKSHIGDPALAVQLNQQQPVRTWRHLRRIGQHTLTAPIRLIANEEQETPHGSYRLLSEGNDWVLQFRHHEHWQSMYHFDHQQVMTEMGLRPVRRPEVSHHVIVEVLGRQVEVVH